MSRPDLTPSLVLRLRAGDAEAGSLLDRLYRESLVRVAYGYLGSLDEAEDAAQEVFVRVLRTRDVPERFRPWVYRIARNHCLNLLRSRRRRRDGGALPPDPTASLTGPFTRAAEKEERARLREALAALPPEQREVVTLRYAEGLSRREIAEVVAIPESLVKTRLYAATRRLRAVTPPPSGGS